MTDNFQEYCGNLFFRMNSESVACEVFLMVAFLLQLPSIIFYGKKRNVPVFSISLWFAILCLNHFISGILWSSGDYAHWWKGYVYCDIIVRLECAAQVSLVCCVIALTRNLCQILAIDSPSVSFGSTRALLVDITICWLPGIIMSILAYIVQYQRYSITLSYGCSYVAAGTVAFIPAYVIWLPICAGIATVYTCIAIYLFRARIQHTKIMFEISGVGMTRSKFIRLCFCCGCLVGVMLPFSIYIAWLEAREFNTSQPFNFASVHNSAIWSIIKMTPYPVRSLIMLRAILLSLAYVVFLTVGLSSDIVKWYKSLLIRILPSYLLSKLVKTGEGASRKLELRSWGPSRILNKKLEAKSPTTSFSSGSDDTFRSSSKSDAFIYALTRNESDDRESDGVGYFEVERRIFEEA